MLETVINNETLQENIHTHRVLCAKFFANNISRNVSYSVYTLQGYKLQNVYFNFETQKAFFFSNIVELSSYVLEHFLQL